MGAKRFLYILKKKISAKEKFKKQYFSLLAISTCAPAALKTNYVTELPCKNKSTAHMLTNAHQDYSIPLLVLILDFLNTCLINYLGFIRNITECCTITGYYSATPFTMDLRVIKNNTNYVNINKTCTCMQ